MSHLLNLHNKTKDVAEDELPFNPNNVMLDEPALRRFFDAHGLANVAYRNINLYRTAFVHRSYCTMKNADFVTGNARCPPGCLPLQEVSYERLEFLGDAVLGMVVARYLYERFPDRDEGFLSGMRTKIVNGRMLGSLAEKMGFPRYIVLSKQVEETQGRNNFKLSEDAFEAFIGALLMDFQTDADTVALPADVGIGALLGGVGFHVAETWITAILETYIDFADLICSRMNYKDQLARYMQQMQNDAPRFFEVNVEKRNHVQRFVYCVKNRAGNVLATASGDSRKQAENEAAKAALAGMGAAV
jgi:ribonuclease-3